jgi:hypothetical protein
MQGSETPNEAELRGSREAALSEVLSSYVEPRNVSYRFVAAFVVLGLAGCLSIAWAASALPAQPPVRFEFGTSELMTRGVAAFNRGDWDEAERLLAQAAQRTHQPVPRLEDYRERLALIRRDGERLAHAEDALEADEPEQALWLLAGIGANSPLFAQAEVLGRAARAQAQAGAPRTQDAVPASPEVDPPAGGALPDSPQAEPAPPARPSRPRARSSVRSSPSVEEAW